MLVCCDATNWDRLLQAVLVCLFDVHLCWHDKIRTPTALAEQLHQNLVQTNQTWQMWTPPEAKKDKIVSGSTQTWSDTHCIWQHKLINQIVFLSMHTHTRTHTLVHKMPKHSFVFVHTPSLSIFYITHFKNFLCMCCAYGLEICPSNTVYVHAACSVRTVHDNFTPAVPQFQ